MVAGEVEKPLVCYGAELLPFGYCAQVLASSGLESSSTRLFVGSYRDA
jgi:hypothetical protein